MNYEKHLLTEGKASVTPYLKSMYKDIDSIDKSTAEQLTKELDKVGMDESIKVTVGVGNNKQAYIGFITSDRKYDDKDQLISKASTALKSIGKSVDKSKIASQELFVYFK